VVVDGARRPRRGGLLAGAGRGHESQRHHRCNEQLQTAAAHASTSLTTWPANKPRVCTHRAVEQTGPLDNKKQNEKLIREKPEQPEQRSGDRWVPAGGVVTVAGTDAQPEVAPGYLSRR